MTGALNDDFRDLLHLLSAAGSRFLVVGAHALAVHGVVRATGDLDVWIERSADNARTVFDALSRFGAPVRALGLSARDFEAIDRVVQIGLPPRRIDVLTGISGAVFEDAWPRRVMRDVAGVPIPFLDRETLVANKRASGRRKDLADLEALGEPVG